MPRNIDTSSRTVPGHNATFHAVDWDCPPDVVSDHGCYRQWQIGLTIRGTSRFRFNGRELTMGPTDMTIIRPTTEIDWRSGSEVWKVSYCVFDPRPHWLPFLQYPETVPGVTMMHLGETALFSKVRRLLHAIVQRYRGGGHDGWAMLVLERLLMTLHEVRSRQIIDPRAHRAMALLDGQYARDWTVEALARECHTSVSSLSAEFRRAANTSPMQYLEGVRMRRALAMLGLGQGSVAEVGRDVGYVYPSYFARRFRRFTGQSPLEYRNASRAAVRGSR